MKRMLACIVALMIALSAAGALAAPGDAILGRSADNNYENYYSGCFAVDDTLYVFNGANIATWRAGDAALVDYTFQFPSKEGEEDVTWSCWPFAANGKVYALAFATRYGENTEFLRAVLCEVSLTGGSDDGNLAKLTEKTPLKWDDMINYYDQDSTATEPQSCVGMGNLCCMLIYGDVGMQLSIVCMTACSAKKTTSASAEAAAEVPTESTEAPAEYSGDAAIGEPAAPLDEGSIEERLAAAKLRVAELEALVEKYRPFYEAQIVATYGDGNIIWKDAALE